MTPAEEEELSKKLSMLNKVLDHEVDFISNQHQRIRSEGFQITPNPSSDVSAITNDDVDIMHKTSIGDSDNEAFYPAKKTSIIITGPDG